MLHEIVYKLDIGERLTNKEWVYLLAREFNMSNTSAKAALHSIMKCKKYDNIKKFFNKCG